MNERRLISSGSKFEAEIGYSRAVVDGDYVWVSGTTGYEYATMTIDVVRVLTIVPRREDWEPCWPVFRKHLGKARPASTLIHAGLQTDIMRIEIEVTARLPKKG